MSKLNVEIEGSVSEVEEMCLRQEVYIYNIRLQPESRGTRSLYLHLLLPSFLPILELVETIRKSEKFSPVVLKGKKEFEGE